MKKERQHPYVLTIIHKRILLPLFGLLLVLLASPAWSMTPAEWLKAQPKPSFRAGHTLPPLTRFGWALDFDTRVELAENWGYCLEFGGADAKIVDRVLAHPEDPGAKCIALVAKDPKKYKLAVVCTRELPKNDAVPPETWTRNAEGKLLNGQAKSLDGTTWTPGMDLVYSPEAPDSVWEEAGRLRAEPLRRIRQKCPIAIVLNGGEYGLSVPGWAKKVWQQDPAIVKAKGDKSWADYASQHKGHAELLIANAVRKAVPDRLLYIYYTTSGGELRNHISGVENWGSAYEDMKAVSDLASSQAYYKHYNSGWTGDNDSLSQILNARTREIALGQPLSYNWLCGGWPHDKEQQDNSTVSDIATYTGFLKCFYTAGMVGGNAGYYAYPVTMGVRGFDAKFPASEPPNWLRQMVALARVHALFSHLEQYLRQGDLLPGPNRHAWSKDLPAHEFPTGDANLRVLARKLKHKPQWLVTAWAADGQDRDARVNVPGPGELTLHARGCGSVYRVALADGQATAELVDGQDAN
jgi:hypothetical protein